MACDDAINQTKRIKFNLKQDTPYDPSTQMLHPSTRAPLDLTGYTFESRFLSKDPDVKPLGATILDEADVTITGDPTNGIYAELLSEAENDALMAAYAALLDIPGGDFGFWEFFATKAGVRHKWFIADVGFEFAGEVSP